MSGLGAAVISSGRSHAYGCSTVGHVSNVAFRNEWGRKVSGLEGKSPSWLSFRFGKVHRGKVVVTRPPLSGPHALGLAVCRTLPSNTPRTAPPPQTGNVTRPAVTIWGRIRVMAVLSSSGLLPSRWRLSSVVRHVGQYANISSSVTIVHTNRLHRASAH